MALILSAKHDEVQGFHTIEKNVFLQRRNVAVTLNNGRLILS
jgi:hypothetical protein